MVTLPSHHYIITLCHIIISYLYIISFHYIISIYHIIYHYIKLSLCLLPVSVAMTIKLARDTGWLPPHDTTAGYDSRSTQNMAIWGKKD